MVTIKDLSSIIDNDALHELYNAQISAYYDEKLYKCGVIDGIILMLESMRVRNAKNIG